LEYERKEKQRKKVGSGSAKNIKGRKARKEESGKERKKAKDLKVMEEKWRKSVEEG
jgi:hypothetical protein